MMNMIKRNPAVAAVFYFILTWAGFPLTALAISQLRGISFAEAVSLPHVILIFSVGSVVSAIQMFYKTKYMHR